MLIETLKEIKSKQLVSRTDIIRITDKILMKYILEMGWKFEHQLRTDLHEIYESVLYPEFEYRLESKMSLGEFKGEKILGKVIPSEKVILIDISLSQVPMYSKYTFTLGHEFGHSVLHSEEKSMFRCNQLDIFYTLPDQLLEVQANTFAEHLIMPDWMVKLKFKQVFQPSRPIRYIGPKNYCLFVNSHDIQCKIKNYTEFCKIFAYHLRHYFSNISKESLGLKLHKLGLLKNETSELFRIGIGNRNNGFKSVSSIMESMI